MDVTRIEFPVHHPSLLVIVLRGLRNSPIITENAETFANIGCVTQFTRDPLKYNHNLYSWEYNGHYVSPSVHDYTLPFTSNKIISPYNFALYSSQTFVNNGIKSPDNLYRLRNPLSCLGWNKRQLLQYNRSLCQRCSS